MSKEKNPVGRPLKFTSPEELQERIDDYFENIPDDEKPIISGLAYHLDVCTDTLRNYESKDGFFATIKKAKQRVEMSLEQSLNGNSVTGSIFSLKNNFGWVDKYENDNNTKIDVIEIRKDFGE